MTDSVTRPVNVLVVMADEQSWNTMGCTGNPAARTPWLDELAGESTVFDACYTPFPLCCPARTSLWTGLMPRHHGVLGNWRPIEPRLRSAGFARSFADAGYYTHYNGKWHVPGTTPERMGWASSSAIPAVLNGQDRGRYIEEYRTWAAGQGYTFDAKHIENLTARDLAALAERPYATSSLPLDAYLETWQCDRFLDSLEQRPTDTPWLAVCSFNAPHFPMSVPSPYDRIIDRDKVRLPESWAGGTASTPREVRESHFARDFEHLSEQDWIEVTSHYLGLCALVDAQLGRIRQYLEDAGEWDRTVVVFTSDHGDMMGAHRLMEKGHWLHYEEDLRVPLIVRHPDGRQSRNANFVSLCDIGPTLCEVAGVPWHEEHDGRSFAGMLGDASAAPIRDYVTAETMLHDGHPGGDGSPFHARDWQWPRDSLNLSVRTAGHRYVFRSHDEAELYDLVDDPHEQRNIAATPEAAPVVARLAGLLADEVADVLPAAAALVRAPLASTAKGTS